jgi:diguanylate cyclase (GGDEF)-like protein
MGQIMSTERPRVLCVDDEPKMLAALQRTLHRSCSVTIARGAAEAIQVMRSEAPFNVVVSDLQMPGIDGIEFLRWVARHSPDTKGILLTGNADLSAAIAAVNVGVVFRFLTKPCTPALLIETIRDAFASCEARQAERLMLRQAVDHDALTGLPDRRRFCEEIERVRAQVPNATLPLIVIAINDLERIRGTLGHIAADNVLVATASRLQAAVRDSQYQFPEPMLFRIDDRFVLVCNASLSAPSSTVALQILRAIESDICVAGQRVRITGRAGVSQIEPASFSPEEEPPALVALRNAEAACRDAGSTESARVVQFSASAHAVAQRHLQISQSVCRPEFVEQLSCVYQPLWGLDTNRLWGIEALVRCFDAELGAVSPAEFIPIAEQYPEAAERIGTWVLETACRQRAAWRDWLPDEVRISVNVSATQLRNGNLHECVAQCLRHSGLPASLLTVEITESAAISDLARSQTQLHQLSLSGVNVAIDDFGVGYSSLSYLAALPATELKIDRSFVDGIMDRGRRAELVRGICSLGHSIGMTVVVEGVESLAVAQWLPRLGCDVVQGFAFSRPLTPTHFREWYQVDRRTIEASLGLSPTKVRATA